MLGQGATVQHRLEFEPMDGRPRRAHNRAVRRRTASPWLLAASAVLLAGLAAGPTAPPGTERPGDAVGPPPPVVLGSHGAAGPPPPVVLGSHGAAGPPPPPVLDPLAAATAPPRPARGGAPIGVPRVTLYTIGPGDDLFEKFGHATLCLRYPAAPRRETVCYDYGTASFERPLRLAWGFLRGAGEFWVSTDEERVMLAHYAADDRTIWRQDLPLTDEQARRVEQRLLADTADRSWRYPYQTYQDNCSTRLRDILDFAVDGALRARTAREPEPTGRTFRELGLGPLAEHPAIVAFLELTLARAADVPISRWESMFRPDRLRLEVERFFGAPAVMVHRRTGPEDRQELGWGATPCFLFVTALLALPLAVARRRGRGERPAIAIMVVPLVGIAIVVWFITWVTRLPEGRYNELMAVFLPVDLALLFLEERRRRWYARLRVAELALVSLLLSVGVFRQPMWTPLLMAFAPFAVLAFLDRREAPAAAAPTADGAPPAVPGDAASPSGNSASLGEPRSDRGGVRGACSPWPHRSRRAKLGPLSRSRPGRTGRAIVEGPRERGEDKMHRRMLAWTLAGGALLLAGACGDDSTTADTGGDTPDVRPDGCLDLCTPGARICSGGGYRECETQANGCADFGEVVPCGAGEVCSGGACGDTCRDVCTEGDTLCSGAGYVTCARQPSGCLDWSDVTPCALGEVCSGGACAASCVDRCSIGVRQCYGDGWQECGTGTAGCAEWGLPVSCPEGEFCAGGVCITACRDLCTPEGATRCQGPGVATCERQASGCLDWGVVVPCGAGEVCTGGSCEERCFDQCAEGATICSGFGVRTCERQASGCLDWSEAAACPDGEVCSDGVCVARCSDVCTDGDTRCAGSGIQTCAEQVSGCLDWGDIAPCPEGQVCSGGTCREVCINQCTEGARRCVAGGYEACEVQPSGCTDWSTPVSCGTGETCSGGVCVPSCSDVCVDGETRCVGSGIQTCALQTSGCYGWNATEACPTGQTCRDGACVPVCTDACTPEGSRSCDTTTAAVRTCSRAADGCLAWGPPVACPDVPNGTPICTAGGVCSATCDPGYGLCGSDCRRSCRPWEWQSPLPPYHTLYALTRVGDTIWAVGEYGIVVRSADAGATWVNVGSGPRVTLRGVDFVDAVRGWAVGDGGTILATTDGGANWSVQASGTTAQINAVSFADANKGWAVGANGTILATTDGGFTWTPQTSGTTQPLLGVHFVNDRSGWAVGGSGTILRTANGGLVWLPQTSGTSNEIRSVHFVDANNGWAAGYSSLYRTTDGGITWNTSYYYGYQFRAIAGVAGATANAVMAVGDGGMVYYSANGGSSWSARTSGTSSALYGVLFLDANRAVAAGATGTVITTANAGATWVSQRRPPTPTPGNLRSVAAVSPSVAWAVGAAGKIYATTDGGATWTAQTSGVSNNLWGVDFANATTGWVVGEGGVIRGTTNGGATWTAQTSGTTNALYAVDFVDASYGWTVGASGTIRFTPDGGATWQAESSGVTTTLRSVRFVNRTNGWVVGDSGTIRVTTNGGVGWTAQTSGRSEALYDIEMIDANTGWVVGASGVVLKTVNGGATWSIVGTPASTAFYGVSFADANNGWIFGASGTALRTIDGINWNSLTIPTGLAVWAADFVSTSVGWVVGDYGTILATRSGGE